MNNSYTALEGDSIKTLGIQAPTFKVGETASFLATSTFVYTLFFVAIIIASFYRYVVAGAYRMQASETAIRQSNEIIKRVTLGLLGVFSLFLILFTVNKGLVRGDVGLQALSSKVVVNKQGTTVAPQQTSSSNYVARKASHDAIVNRLASSGIKTNHNNASCTEEQFKEAKPSCTSLAYLPEESIRMLLKLNSGCSNCSLTVTGGTEPGHKSHGENKRPFDLRIRASQDISDPLYAHIKSIAKPFGSNGQCYMKYVYDSFTFCDERPPANKAPTWAAHFHVY